MDGADPAEQIPQGSVTSATAASVTSTTAAAPTGLNRWMKIRQACKGANAFTDKLQEKLRLEARKAAAKPKCGFMNPVRIAGREAVSAAAGSVEERLRVLEGSMGRIADLIEQQQRRLQQQLQRELSPSPLADDRLSALEAGVARIAQLLETREKAGEPTTHLSGEWREGATERQDRPRAGKSPPLTTRQAVEKMPSAEAHPQWRC